MALHATIPVKAGVQDGTKHTVLELILGRGVRVGKLWLKLKNILDVRAKSPSGSL